MFKKLILLAMAVGALVAFAAPAIAQASKFTEGGIALEPGAQVTATSSNLERATASGILKCASVVLNLEVTGNSPAEVEQIGEAETAGCRLQIGPNEAEALPETVTDWTFGPLTLNEWGTGETGTTFISHIFGDAEHTILLATCHFEGTMHLQATGGSGLAFGPSGLAGEGAGCPEAGLISGNFSLATPGGAAVTVDFTAT